MITIKIKTDNAAFQDLKWQEIRRILHGLCNKMDDGVVLPINLYDVNGNKVGDCKETKS